MATVVVGIADEKVSVVFHGIGVGEAETHCRLSGVGLVSCVTDDEDLTESVFAGAGKRDGEGLSRIAVVRRRVAHEVVVSAAQCSRRRF